MNPLRVGVLMGAFLFPAVRLKDIFDSMAYLVEMYRYIFHFVKYLLVGVRGQRQSFVAHCSAIEGNIILHKPHALFIVYSPSAEREACLWRCKRCKTISQILHFVCLKEARNQVIGHNADVCRSASYCENVPDRSSNLRCALFQLAARCCFLLGVSRRLRYRFIHVQERTISCSALAGIQRQPSGGC